MAIGRLLRQRIVLHVEDGLVATVRPRLIRRPTQHRAAQVATVRMLEVEAAVVAPLALGVHDGHAPVPQWFTHLHRCNH